MDCSEMVQTNHQTFIRDLGDGLILRRSTPADAEKLGAFNAMIHSDDGADRPDDRLAVWTSDLLTRPHPTFGTGDFTIVEEQATGRIVSSLNHISQTWAYEGIPFKAGRPELVGTLPEYRHRRLVGIQMDEIHRWSRERGELLQGITGIPHYYRRFGYEMGLELSGGRVGYEPLVPKLKDGEAEPYTTRAATEADIPLLMELYALGCRRGLVSTVRTEEIWRYELGGKSERNATRNVIRIIERASGGEAVGYLLHAWFNWNLGLLLFEYELKPGVSWWEVTPSVARYMLTTGREYAARDDKPLEQKSVVAFWHGSAHPVYEVWREKLPRIRPTYAWYVRVPDLPAFIRHIAPVLERRIAESYVPGYSGAVRLNSYHNGLQLVFEKGLLKEAASYRPEPDKMGEIGLPDLTVLQLVFGYRSLDELKASYADCYFDSDEARLVVSTLFPKKPSWVSGLA
jgi:GNAT acetyltransferase-like protein